MLGVVEQGLRGVVRNVSKTRQLRHVDVFLFSYFFYFESYHTW